MTHSHLAVLMAAALAGAALTACSDETALTPESASEPVEPVGGLARAAAGSYLLSFLSNGQVVTSLPVGYEVILKAEVTDAFGAPAQSGTVAFQYCSYKGLPPNDITRADEAPKEACESGDATWARLQTVRVTASGIPLVGFPAVQIPRTIGFRFKYSGGQSSGIASGTATANFTWCPLSGCQ